LQSRVLHRQSMPSIRLATRLKAQGCFGRRPNISRLAAKSELLNDSRADHLLDSHLALIFEHYLDPNTGFWVNQLDPDNQAIMAEIPVRVLYHLFLAFAEVCRVRAVAL
jgi:mannose/cellobiose epimerase-like protein (N-acyl-D-glucosamine 2-epimerase family)